MKLLCISDTHGQHKQLDLSIYTDCEILIHTGDFTRSRVHYEAETQEFVDWLEAQPFKHKLLVAGNHDFYPAEYPGRFKYMCDKRGINYLQDSSITVEGINFYGSPWTPPFYDWAFMAQEQELSEYYRSIPTDTDVLLTHGPAFGILDETLECKLAGSTALAEVVKELDLKAHIFGHIHEESSMITKNGCTYINASMISRSHKLVNKPYVLTL